MESEALGHIHHPDSHPATVLQDYIRSTYTHHTIRWAVSQTHTPWSAEENKSIETTPHKCSESITGSPKHNPLYSVPLSQRPSCPHPSILFYTAPHTVIKSSETTFPSRHRNLSNTHQLHLWKKVAPKITAKTDIQRRLGHSQNTPRWPHYALPPFKEPAAT